MIVASRGLNSVESGLLYVGLAVFAGAAVVGLRVVAGRRRGRGLPTMLAIGTVALTLLLAIRAAEQGRLPVGHRYEILLVVAWCVALAAWLLNRRLQLPVLAAVAAPAACMLIFFAILLVPGAAAASPELRMGKFTHILLALFGFAAFTFAAAVGVLYLWQIRILKNNPLAAVSRRVPPLEVLDSLNYLAAAFGFPLLALSVVGGWLFARPEGLSARGWLDPTILTTVVALLVYLLLFSARALLGWRGRRIAWLTVIGFVVIVVGFVVGSLCTSPNVIHSS